MIDITLVQDNGRNYTPRHSKVRVRDSGIRIESTYEDGTTTVVNEKWGGLGIFRNPSEYVKFLLNEGYLIK